MLYTIVALVLALIGSGAIFLFSRITEKRVLGGSKEAAAALLQQIADVSAKIHELAKFSSSYVSAESVGAFETRLNSVRGEINSEAQRLKEVETKLDTAQKSVEQRELEQQEIKSAKEHEEELLIELRQKYEEYSESAITLEQRLAQSLKNLDVIMSELTLTSEQKTTLEEFSNSLTAGGARLRDLLTEYQVVADRLKMLQQQHQDLESEYTKLVEQQLGD